MNTAIFTAIKKWADSQLKASEPLEPGLYDVHVDMTVSIDDHRTPYCLEVDLTLDKSPSHSRTVSYYPSIKQFFQKLKEKSPSTWSLLLDEFEHNPPNLLEIVDIDDDVESLSKLLSRTDTREVSGPTKLIIN